MTYTITAAQDGSDVTADMQDQLDVIPHGVEGNPNTVLFPLGLSDGKYHTEGDMANNPLGANGVLRIEGLTHCIIRGPSAADPATFYTEAPGTAYATTYIGSTTSKRRHFWFIDCHDVTAKWLRVEGGNTPHDEQVPAFWTGTKLDSNSKNGYPAYRAQWEAEHAFEIRQCTNFVLEEFEVWQVWGDGVYVGHSGHPTGSVGVTVRQGLIERTGRQGVALGHCQDVLLEYLTIDYGRRSAVDLEPHADELLIDGVEMRYCTSRVLMTHVAALGRGSVNNVDIHHNIYIGTGMDVACGNAPRIQRRTNWRYAYNIRTGNHGSPYSSIRFHMVDGVTVEGNTTPCRERLLASDGSVLYGANVVRLDDCGGILEVIDNDFRRTQGDGLGGCTFELWNGTPAPTDTGNTYGSQCTVTGAP